MGIELPGELTEVAAAVGLAWPEADETAMAAQAEVWRRAQRELTALAADADDVVGAAVKGLSGTVGEAATAAWAKVGDPELGTLGAAARDAGAAADRLEHAAERIAKAKVEMVEQLIQAAKQRDAAHVAAQAGHPDALLGLDTVFAGTAAVLGGVREGLVAELATAEPGRTPPSGIPLAPDTGPVRAPYEGLLPDGGFEDVPTPPSGTALSGDTGPIPKPAQGTQAAGFTDAGPGAAPAAPAAPPAVSQPGAPPGYAPPAYPYQQQPYPPYRQQPGQPVPPGYPPVYPQAPRRPSRRQPLGAPRRERESIVALFLVHMFPIGHLPVAADRPARQLPHPAPGTEASCFPPHDHPESGRMDSTEALGKIHAGWRRHPTPPGTAPEEVLAGYEPAAGVDEQAWPPAEEYPEGCREPGEPVLLPEGTELDRFGPVAGRVFAPAGVAFAGRSLPPAFAAAEYRRYRVRRTLPVWHAVSAPWFGQDGGAVRYRTLYSADELVTMGYLVDVTFEGRGA
ncbi:TNT domain-containing protein [Amycolatopsis suaedae]|uniref:DUF4237 domain-containing protein n=1 Tax=Amycolatopsis suaedae TaxID=2510978 RepID=A0A4Q7J6H4_9PSEU|nr:TNT domain-containing protein [Amycolatopsis suaedae]RZQ62739.1 DUF4237 domain-containing protein [Amycolatopsis suaedae]